jgi:hypothetical protein
MAPSTCRPAAIYVPVHRTSQQELQAAAVKPGHAGILTSIDLCAQASRLRRSQRDWTLLPCVNTHGACSSNTYTCTVRVGDRRHFCPLTCSNIVAGKPRSLKHYIRYVTHHARCNRHWAGLHALLGRENHVYGPAEGQLHP